MFGLGFTEILLIAVVALLFIGPDKLPETMKTVARTLGKAKRMFDDTKDTIQNELRIDDLREEALSYRNQIEQAKEDLSAFKNVANKELEEVAQSARINNSVYKPTDINDDSDLFEDFEKAEKEFEELDKKPSEKSTDMETADDNKAQEANETKTVEKTETKNPYANSNHEERFEELKKESISEGSKEKKTQTVNFKHLKTKDS